jgi:serine protease Do
VINQLREFGETRRGWLGVRIQNVDDAIAESLNLGAARGALVAGVDDRGPSKPAGIKTGDVITKFDGQDIKDSRDLPKIVAGTPVGKQVTVTVVRDGKEQDLRVTVGRLDESVKQASLDADKSNPSAPGKSVVQRALGMEFASMSDATRKKFNIKDSVKGVVVTNVAPDSAAADKHISPGDTIAEINQETISNPEDITKKVQDLKNAGRKSALFLLVSPEGENRFVPLRLE